MQLEADPWFVKQHMQEAQLMQKCLILPLTMERWRTQALFNPEPAVLIQKRHPYTGDLNSETPGDSTNAFLHWGYVLGMSDIYAVVFADCRLL